MIVIGFSGRAGSGKDTIAERVHSAFTSTGYNVKMVAIADDMKVILSELFLVPLDNFHDRKTKEEMDDFWGLTHREMCTKFGSDMVKPALGNDFWIRRLARKLENITCDVLLITDIRFLEDMELVTRRGGTIVFIDADERLGPLPENAHESERQTYKVKAFSQDIITNNASLVDFEIKIKQFVKKVKSNLV